MIKRTHVQDNVNIIRSTLITACSTAVRAKESVYIPRLATSTDETKRKTIGYYAHYSPDGNEVSFRYPRFAYYKFRVQL